MDTQVILEKPKKRFSVGGVLCIVIGLLGGLFTFIGFLGYAMNILRNISTVINAYDYDIFSAVSDMFSAVSYFSWDYWLDALITGAGFIFAGISELLFIVFGILLMCKAHGKLLAAFPIAQIALMIVPVLATAYGIVYYVLSMFGGYSFGVVTFGLVMNAVNIPVVLLKLAGWVMLLVVIFANCKRSNEQSGKGRLRSFSVLIPISFASGFALTFGNVLLTTFMKIFMNNFAFAYYHYDLLSIITDIAYSFITSGSMAVLYAVTFFLVTRWIIDPYKKTK